MGKAASRDRLGDRSVTVALTRLALAEGRSAAMDDAGKRMWLPDLGRMRWISFRIRPMYVSLAGDRPEIGFELELIGTHPAVRQHADSGCAHCRSVLFALLDLADRGLHTEQTAARTISTRCEKLVRYRANNAYPPEVVLRVTVVRSMSLNDLEEDRILKLADDVRKALQGFGCQEVAFGAVKHAGLCQRVGQRGRAA